MYMHSTHVAVSGRCRGEMGHCHEDCLLGVTNAGEGSLKASLQLLCPCQFERSPTDSSAEDFQNIW